MKKESDSVEIYRNMFWPVMIKLHRAQAALGGPLFFFAEKAETTMSNRMPKAAYQLASG